MTIDLHGIKHADVEKVLEDFFADYKGPYRIITGNSIRMKELVTQMLDKNSMKHSDFGTSIITD